MILFKLVFVLLGLFLFDEDGPEKKPKKEKNDALLSVFIIDLILSQSQPELSLLFKFN